MAKKPIKPKKKVKKKKIQYGPGDGPPPMPSLHRLIFRKPPEPTAKKQPRKKM